MALKDYIDNEALRSRGQDLVFTFSFLGFLFLGSWRAYVVPVVSSTAVRRLGIALSTFYCITMCSLISVS